MHGTLVNMDFSSTMKEILEEKLEIAGEIKWIEVVSGLLVNE